LVARHRRSPDEREEGKDLGKKRWNFRQKEKRVRCWANMGTTGVSMAQKREREMPGEGKGGKTQQKLPTSKANWELRIAGRRCRSGGEKNRILLA